MFYSMKYSMKYSKTVGPKLMPTSETYRYHIPLRLVITTNLRIYILDRETSATRLVMRAILEITPKAQE